MEREAIAVEAADVYLLKWIDDRGQRHPVVKYELTNDRANEVTLRVEETMPAGVAEDDVAFHPTFHADSWSYEEGVATFERELGRGETLVTGFALRDGTLDDLGVLMVPPVVTALDVPDLGTDPLIEERTEFEELTVDVADVDEPLDSPAVADPVVLIGDDPDDADGSVGATPEPGEPSEDELIESLIERGGDRSGDATESADGDDAVAETDPTVAADDSDVEAPSEAADQESESEAATDVQMTSDAEAEPPGDEADAQSAADTETEPADTETEPADTETEPADDEEPDDTGATVFPAESKPDESREPPSIPDDPATVANDEETATAPPWRDRGDDEDGPLGEAAEPVPDDDSGLDGDDTDPGPVDRGAPGETTGHDVPDDVSGSDPLATDEDDLAGEEELSDEDELAGEAGLTEEDELADVDELAGETGLAEEDELADENDLSGETELDDENDLGGETELADSEGTDPLTADSAHESVEQGDGEDALSPAGEEDSEFGSPDSTGSDASLDPDDGVATGEEFTTGSLEPTGGTGPPPENADVVDESSEAATDDVEKAVEAVEQELDLTEEGDDSDDEEFVDDGEGDGPDAGSTEGAVDADASAGSRSDTADASTASPTAIGEDGAESDEDHSDPMTDPSDESPVTSGAMQGPEPYSAGVDEMAGPRRETPAEEPSGPADDVAAVEAGEPGVDGVREQRDEPEEPRDGATDGEVETDIEADVETAESAEAAVHTDAEAAADEGEEAGTLAGAVEPAEPEAEAPPVADVAASVPVTEDYTVGDLVDAAAYTELRAEGVDPRVVAGEIRDVLYDLAADRNYELRGSSDVLQFHQATIGTRTGSTEGRVTAVGPWRRLASDSVEYTRRRSGLAATLLLVGFATLVAGGLLRSSLGLAPDVAAALSIRPATVRTDLATGSLALGTIVGIGGLIAYLRPASHTRERSYYYREVQKVLLAGPVSEREVETDIGTLTDLYGDLRVHVGTDVQVVVREDGTESVRSLSELTEEERSDLEVRHDGLVTATSTEADAVSVERRRRSDVLE